MLAGQFWGAYKPPGVPLLYAAMFFFTGSYDVDLLRWMQLLIFVMSVAFLAWQIIKDSESLLTGMLLLLTIALTKSSVFWSLSLVQRHYQSPCFIFHWGLQSGYPVTVAIYINI